MALNNTHLRVKVQDLLDRYTVRASGDFHSDELDVDSFISAMQKKFKIKPKEKGEAEDLLRDLITYCTKKVRGRMTAKELKTSIFIKKLFEKFEIEGL